MSAMRAAEAVSISTRSMETSMERLSTGKRINASSDDAAGVAISSRLSAEIRGANQAIRNSLDGQALIDTAEGAHSEIENILQRMREVAVQSANDTNNTQDRLNLQSEMDAMITEIDRIAGTTTWAGEDLMSAASQAFTFQVGAATGTDNQITVTVKGMSASDLSLDSSSGISADDFTIGQHTDTTNNDAKSNTISLSGSGTTFDLALVDVASSTESAGAYSLKLDGVTVTLTGDEQADQKKINDAFGDLGVSAAIKADVDTSFAHGTFGDATDGTNHGGKAYLTITLPAASGSGISVQDGAKSISAITDIDTAIKDVNVQRSKLGAVSNRLNHTVNNLTNISSNLSAAKGGIEDADFALETTNLAKNQILQQASTAMLAQANASQQNVLALLRS